MTRSPRPIRIEGDVAYVPLTKGYEAIIDVADVPLVDGVNWCAKENRGTVYACRNIRVGNKVVPVQMHRALLNAPEGVFVDHEDRNGLNNRRSSNLRLADRCQNQWNRGASKRNTSGTKGVSWSAREGKWRAAISVKNKFVSLGYFDSKEAAAAVYASASAAMHGEFGRVA